MKGKEKTTTKRSCRAGMRYRDTAGSHGRAGEAAAAPAAAGDVATAQIPLAQSVRANRTELRVFGSFEGIWKLVVETFTCLS